MPRAVTLAVVLPLSGFVLSGLLLSGCALVSTPGSPLAEPSTPEPTVTFVYTPSSAGWDPDYVTGTYMESPLLIPLCEYDEWVWGAEILEVIPRDELAGLDYVACAFGPIPGSTDPDELLEIVFSVDDGAAALVEAFSTTGRVGEPAAAVCSIDPTLSTPNVITRYDGVGYMLTAGPDWCPADVQTHQAVLDNLILSVVASDEVTFGEY